MEEVTIAAEVGRGVGKSANRRLRRDGMVPAIVYGLGGANRNVSLRAHDLEVLFSRPGGARALVNLVVDGGTELVMPRQIQRNAVRRHLVHIDLLRVSRDTAVSVELPVHLVGEPTGVATGGLLEQALFTLAVEGRPGDLPAALEVDVSALDIGNQIRVADLVLPVGVVTSAPPDDLVASVVAPRAPVATEDAEGAAEEASSPAEG